MLEETQKIKKHNKYNKHKKHKKYNKHKKIILRKILKKTKKI